MSKVSTFDFDGKYHDMELLSVTPQGLCKVKHVLGDGRETTYVRHRDRVIARDDEARKLLASAQGQR